MNSLLFLLILDFSGSMYQRVREDVKYELLQKNVAALLTAAENENGKSSAGVLAFGLHPKKKCDDLSYQEQPLQKVSQIVNGYRPGSFSKTPLAQSIARGTKITIERKVRRVVIFSDGADSCGQDPCQQLARSNEILKNAGQVMQMTFIGIDLKKDASKFECFRHSLSHIKIQFSDIEDSFQAQEILKDNQSELQTQVQKPFGTLEVRGAPPSVHFSVKGKGGPTWLGAYKQKIRRGYYVVESGFPQTRAVNVEIREEEGKVIYWSDFFLNPRGGLIDQDKSLTLLLTPQPSTQAAHRKVDPVLVEGHIPVTNEKRTTSLPFGQWTVEIISPPWLKKQAEKKTLTIDPHSNKSFDFFSLFELHWAPVPDPNLRHVFEISEGQRYLVQKGSKMIPLSSSQKANWIKSSE